MDELLSRVFQRRDITLGTLILAVFALLALPTPAAEAQLRTPVERPLAFRGGTLLIPLVGPSDLQAWPAAVPLTLSNNREVIGHVVWVYPRPIPSLRRWTDDPRHLAVATHADFLEHIAEQSEPPTERTAFLAAQMPDDVDGEIRMGGQRLQPHWRNRVHTLAIPAALLPDRPDGDLIHLQPQRRETALPDVDSPFEHWRWALLSLRADMPAPPLSRFEPSEALIAAYYADLWLSGLAQLRDDDLRIAARCLTLLTRRCMGDVQEFAAWVADPQQTDQLSAILSDPNRSATSRVRSAAAWCDSQSPLLLVPGRSTHETVEVLAINRHDQPMPLRMWVEHARDRNRPLATVIDPGTLRMFELARPPQQHRTLLGEPAAARPVQVNIEIAGGAAGETTRRRYGAVFPPLEIAVKPPGFTTASFHPPLTLSDVESTRQPTVDPARATVMQARRMGGRWEIFIECRRPQLLAEDQAASGDRDESLNGDRISTFGGSAMDPRDLAGVEAVTLLLDQPGSDTNDRVVLMIPERGWWQLLFGDNDGTLQVHRRSYDDRWYCRVVLPEGWLPPEPDDGYADREGRATTMPAPRVLAVGVIRSHGDSGAIETAPARSVPWQIDPGAFLLDISQWSDLPAEPMEVP